MNIKSIGAFLAEYLPKAAQIAELVISVMPVGAQVINAVKLANTIAAGVVNAEPALVAIADEIQAVKNSGEKVTQEKWAEYNAAADKAHADLQAALSE
jgi:hypothetical protein